MLYYTLKIVISALLIVGISEIAKRNTLVGGLLASVPLVSVLAMIWLYVETQDLQKISEFSSTVFWLVIPSLMLFVSFPLLVKNGLGFYLSLSLSIILTIVCYSLMMLVLKKFDIQV